MNSCLPNPALYFDPGDPQDIAVAIGKFYADPSIKERLVIAGKKRLDLFSWKNAAEETVQVYKKLLQG